jgi:hypothetical protein
MRKRIFVIISCICISIVLVSWGWRGHEIISNNISLSFFDEMAQFSAWPAYLSSHASDADDRKATDPTEAPKHYIDIDNYAEFNTNHKIPQTLDSVIAIHGNSFVYNEGILPWATLATYDSLRNAFIHSDINKALFFASDLGHYVADGHMPLHITKNYDGQYSGNDGIHSRYESTMISGYYSQIIYTGDTVKIIPNVNQYVFNYLYNNFKYVDSVMLADNYAYGQSSNYNSTTYKAALWNKTKNLTIILFKNGSHALAELIYNAWVEAGSPAINTLDIADNSGSMNFLQNSPNPFSVSTSVCFNLNEQSENVNLSVYDNYGRQVSVLFDGACGPGAHNIRWTPQHLSVGIYFLVLRNGSQSEYQKMVFVK